MRASGRKAILLTAAAGLATIAGLAIHGPVGGALLLVVATVLVLFSRSAWAATRPEGRPLRVVVVAAVVAVAVLKFAGKL